MPETDPIRPTDEAARSLARQLMREARFAALAVIAETMPLVTRVGFGLDENGAPVTLISDLSAHSRALRADPRASLLVGEPGAKGDPLTHPRLSLQAEARFIDRDDPAHAGIEARWLRDHPNARLYIGFADFHLVRFRLLRGLLNGGFGQAFVLSPEDLGQ
jgi:putative heme iron utilization protein